MTAKSSRSHSFSLFVCNDNLNGESNDFVLNLWQIWFKASDIKQEWFTSEVITCIKCNGIWLLRHITNNLAQNFFGFKKKPIIKSNDIKKAEIL